MSDAAPLRMLRVEPPREELLEGRRALERLHPIAHVHLHAHRVAVVDDRLHRVDALACEYLVRLGVLPVADARVVGRTVPYQAPVLRNVVEHVAAGARTPEQRLEVGVPVRLQPLPNILDGSGPQRAEVAEPVVHEEEALGLATGPLGLYGRHLGVREGHQLYVRDVRWGRCAASLLRQHDFLARQVGVLEETLVRGEVVHPAVGSFLPVHRHVGRVAGQLDLQQRRRPVAPQPYEYRVPAGHLQGQGQGWRLRLRPGEEQGARDALGLVRRRLPVVLKVPRGHCCLRLADAQVRDNYRLGMVHRGISRR